MGGILSLWKGHLTTIVRVGPFSALSYAAHDYSEILFKEQLNVKQLPVAYKFIAGSIGGAVGTVLTYPLDVLRIRLALVPNMTWGKALRSGGHFHGLFPTLLGIVPYSGDYNINFIVFICNYI
jgi:solute carrier family 25 phosphate transporter 23/24/25/41